MKTATVTLNGIKELVCITGMKLTYIKTQIEWQLIPCFHRAFFKVDHFICRLMHLIV